MAEVAEMRKTTEPHHTENKGMQTNDLVNKLHEKLIDDSIK